MPKIKKLNKVCSNAQKCENYASFKQNYTLELFIALKMVYSCCLGSRRNLDFPDFLQKSLKTSTTVALVITMTMLRSARTSS